MLNGIPFQECLIVTIVAPSISKNLDHCGSTSQTGRIHSGVMTETTQAALTKENCRQVLKKINFIHGFEWWFLYFILEKKSS